MSMEIPKKHTPPLAGEGGSTNDQHSQYSTNRQLPIDQVLNEIRTHGYTRKKTRAGFKCCCPAHDDQNPSLSINTGDDGKALVKCHAGIAPVDVDRLALEIKKSMQIGKGASYEHSSNAP